MLQQDLKYSCVLLIGVLTALLLHRKGELLKLRSSSKDHEYELPASATTTERRALQHLVEQKLGSGRYETY